ncbi:MAG: tetratricopeptide repeat protein [Thermoplasmata archaeon]|nr:tetratricopeptide repeat protein [Thermoplasmata archaeon]
MAKSEDKIKCEVCGHLNHPKVEFCEECGVKLGVSEGEEDIDKLLEDLAEIDVPAEGTDEALDLDKEIVDELLDSLLIEEEGDLFECPVCSSMIAVESSVCPDCGTEFAELLEKPREKAKPEEEIEIPAEEEVPVKVEVSEKVPKLTTSSARMIDGIVIGTIVALVVVFVVFQMWDWNVYSESTSPLIVFAGIAVAGTLLGFVFFKISTSAVAQGDRLVKDGHYLEAIQHYNRAIRIGSRPATAWTSKGVAYKRLKQYDEALKCHDIALKMNPKNEIAWTNKGDVLFRLERFDEALEAFEKALDIRPKYAIAWNNMGATLARMGRFEDAKKCHDQAIKIRPRYPAAWLNRGEVLVRLGERDEAAKCLQKAKSLGA